GFTGVETSARGFGSGNIDLVKKGIGIFDAQDATGIAELVVQGQVLNQVQGFVDGFSPGDPVFATYMTIPAALSSTDTIVFGDDIIYAGNGADNDMFGDAVTISGSGTITGGADMLYAGTGTDDMWGDWITAGDNTATTGADKFIFEASLFGNLPSALGDTIHDFEVAWDQIVVRNSGLTFALLDTNISGALDVGDLNVSVSGVGISIDLGAATLDLNDTQVIQVLGVFSLSSTDIIFQEDGLIA
ncbi:MAG TPA: hypothetical protein VLA52_14915, partial [Thermohalobaculum sp.]|nr:hypothetical protein [Thermohalobaculum sp.]